MGSIKKFSLFTIGAFLTFSSIFTYSTKATETVKNDRAKELVNIVSSQKNKPYQYGATGPNSFDCSGLIYYSVGQMPSINLDGKQMKVDPLNELGRTTNNQYNAYKAHYVSTENRRPGDIVFFGYSGYNVTHEGMYIGGDNFVHAPRTNDVVKQSYLWNRGDVLPKVRRIEGWLQEGNSWKFLVADEEIDNKWILDNNVYYYINDYGYMEENNWKWVDGACYKFDSNGVMESNTWLWDTNNWYYVGYSGYMITNNWVKYKDFWYYLDSDGSMKKNSWLQLNDKTYYMDSNGVMTIGWTTIEGKEYYFYQDGSMARNTIIGSKKIGPDGTIIK